MAAVSGCFGHRILYMGVVGSKSHKINYMPMAEALAAKGHHVTVVTPFSKLETRENVHEINVPDLGTELQIDWFQVQQDGRRAIQNVIYILSAMSTRGYDILMANKEFRKIVDERSVDLVIVDSVANDFVLPIVDSLKVPYVIYSPASALTSTLDGMGIPMEYASVPAGILDFTSDMNFFQRLVNVVATESFSALSSLYLDRIVDEHVKKDFPQARPLAEIKRDASLCLINHPWVTAYPRPLPPGVVPIGPLHVRPAKQLPQVILIIFFKSIIYLTNNFVDTELANIGRRGNSRIRSIFSRIIHFRLFSASSSAPSVPHSIR